MTIVIMLVCAFIFLVVFFVANQILTNFRLKAHQKEWDEIKAMLIAFAPHITQDELRETYVNFINEIQGYYPRF